MAAVSPTMEDLAKWQDYRGRSPFGMANSSHATDRSFPILSAATALLEILSAAAQDSSALNRRGDTSEFDKCSGSVLAGALDGIGILVSLAARMVEG